MATQEWVNTQSVIASDLTADETAQIKLFLQYWEIDSNGNLLPKTTNTVDIGKAEQKIRDIYEHQ